MLLNDETQSNSVLEVAECGVFLHEWCINFTGFSEKGER